MKSFYRLGEYEIDVFGRRVSRDGELLPLSGKPIDVLLALLERPGRVVSKDELIEAVWPDAAVEDGNLTQCIFNPAESFRRAGSESTLLRHFAR